MGKISGHAERERPRQREIHVGVARGRGRRVDLWAFGGRAVHQRERRRGGLAIQ